MFSFLLLDIFKFVSSLYNKNNVCYSGKNLNGKSGGREIIKNGEMQKVDSSSQVKIYFSLNICW